MIFLKFFEMVLVESSSTFLCFELKPLQDISIRISYMHGFKLAFHDHVPPERQNVDQHCIFWKIPNKSLFRTEWHSLNRNRLKVGSGYRERLWVKGPEFPWFIKKKQNPTKQYTQWQTIVWADKYPSWSPSMQWQREREITFVPDIKALSRGIFQIMNHFLTQLTIGDG